MSKRVGLKAVQTKEVLTKTTLMAVTGGKSKEISIPVLNLEVIQVSVRGLSPLIMGSFSEKSIAQMRDQQTGKGDAVMAREKKDPVACFEASKVKDLNGRLCAKSLWFKCGIVDACRSIGGGRGRGKLSMPLLRGAVFVRGDLLPLSFRGEVVMREDMVRNANGNADIRYRAEVPVGWECTFEVEFNPSVVSAEQILTLLRNAGYGGGVGEWRPQKAASGQFGRYEIANAAFAG